MSRGKSPFTKTQFDRAIELVHGAGYVMTGFRKHADGFTIITSKPEMTGKPGEGRAEWSAKPLNEWDQIFNGEDQSETR
jgi:hypothetical protein